MSSHPWYFFQLIFTCLKFPDIRELYKWMSEALHIFFLLFAQSISEALLISERIYHPHTSRRDEENKERALTSSDTLTWRTTGTWKEEPMSQP